MGREVRRVPKGWVHPQREDGRSGPQPMCKWRFKEKADEWVKEFMYWESGEHPRQKDPVMEGQRYWEWAGNPPDREYYAPYDASTPLPWFQAYETVSEGTPVSPAFATAEELITYLAEHGDAWDQKRAGGRPAGWGRESAEAFVKAGWTMTMMMTERGQVIEGKDIHAHLEKTKSNEPA